MPNIPRYLITTADERTWKFDRPVIFLGEWCRPHDRRHVWQGMDAIVAEPYGLSQAQKDADHAESRALEEKLFNLLSDALNHYHGTRHTQRFWLIILGNWLKRYVSVILNRVRTLDQCLQAYQLSGTALISDERYSLAPQDSYAAIWAFNDDRWNNALYFYILKLLDKDVCPVDVVAGDESDGFRWHSTSNALPLKRRIVSWGYQQVRRLTGFLAREDDALFINSYLPKDVEIRLQLALGQLPQLWTSPQFVVTKKPDRAIRQRLAARSIGVSSDPLFGIMCALVFELLPVCYLECFDELAEKVRQLPWPKRPKFIFTSNNFDTNDVFKLWTATKVESGSLYVVGQHGNNYGTHRHLDNHSNEEKTADKFLTWGWTDGLPQHTPAFVFKNSARLKNMACNPDGGLLLIELCMGHRLPTWDVWGEFAAYFQDQQAFVSKLTDAPRDRLTVRLHAAYRQQKWGEDERWREFCPSLEIDAGGRPIRELIAQSRLIVHSYDSTGILETLMQNIPTLAFWQNGFDHLRDSAKPYYQLLVDAGIVHLTAESVAAKVNEVWDDVEGWWGQGFVQEARALFCNHYARVDNEPVQTLSRLLTASVSEGR